MIKISTKIGVRFCANVVCHDKTAVFVLNASKRRKRSQLERHAAETCVI